MYDNENITQNTNHNNNQENPAFTNGYQTYQYTGAIPQSTIENGNNQNQLKTPKKNSALNYIKKALACTSLGLFFGLCAGIGFYLVVETTGINKTQVSKEIPVENEQIDETNQTTLQQNLIKETDSNTVSNVRNQEIPDIKDTVKKVMPAMVSIVNEYTETFHYFGQELSQQGESSGSGIIVGESDTELLIVTNYHVVAGSDEIKVAFIDGTQSTAKIKGTDSDMDLAVIAVKMNEIPGDTKKVISIAPLGDSDELELGEYVIAIGNALGYGQSVTDGIVSALDRKLVLEDGSEGTFIQTNAAINPGNSGGALLNARGEVIGINSNKIGGNIVEGMGYAIPISAAKPIIEELMVRETREKVSADEVGYMGLTYFPVDAESAKIYGWEEGLYVREILPDSAAMEAGLKTGDIIIKIDGNRVRNSEELSNVIQYYPAGETIILDVMRNQGNGYEKIKIEITLGEKPSNN